MIYYICVIHEIYHGLQKMIDRDRSKIQEWIDKIFSEISPLMFKWRNSKIFVKNGFILPIFIIILIYSIYNQMCIKFI